MLQRDLKASRKFWPFKFNGCGDMDLFLKCVTLYYFHPVNTLQSTHNGSITGKTAILKVLVLHGGHSILLMVAFKALHTYFYLG